MIARVTALGLALGLIGSLPASAQTIAITDATVYPVSGPKIEHGTVLIRDGKIAAVGASVTIPEGATRIDGAGKIVTPGLFHANGVFGVALLESNDGGATYEAGREGDVNAEFNVADGLNPSAITIPVGRLDGITTAVLRPQGNLIAGQVPVIDLAGERVSDMVVERQVAMAAELDQGSRSAGGGSRAGAIERLRQILRDAAEYQRRKADFRRAQIQPLAAPAADLEAMAPVLAGKIPLYVSAERRSDIERAVQLTRDFPQVRIIVLGGAEAWQMASELAAAKIPVAVDPRLDIPSFNGLGPRLDNAALLQKAGVPLVITQGPTVDDPNTWRDLRQVAGLAVGYGLPWDAALKAITLTPAQVFGVGDRYGSLEAGKVADVVLWSGDPLDTSSQAVQVWVRGKPVPMTSRQTRLFERYKNLPPQY